MLALWARNWLPALLDEWRSPIKTLRVKAVPCEKFSTANNHISVS